VVLEQQLRIIIIILHRHIQTWLACYHTTLAALAQVLNCRSECVPNFITQIWSKIHHGTTNSDERSQNFSAHYVCLYVIPTFWHLFSWQISVLAFRKYLNTQYYFPLWWLKIRDNSLPIFFIILIVHKYIYIYRVSHVKLAPLTS
jgi:hypothetical protein